MLSENRSLVSLLSSRNSGRYEALQGISGWLISGIMEDLDLDWFQCVEDLKQRHEVEQQAHFHVVRDLLHLHQRPCCSFFIQLTLGLLNILVGGLIRMGWLWVHSPFYFISIPSL